MPPEDRIPPGEPRPDEPRPEGPPPRRRRPPHPEDLPPGDAYVRRYDDPRGPSDERSLVDLLSELTSETSALVRQELNLVQTEVSEKASEARREVSQKASEAGKDVAYVGLGGAVAYAGLIVLLFGLALLLGLLMPEWLAFLIVGVAVALIGYALLQSGLSGLRKIDYSLSTDFTLSKTKESLREDKQWMKEEAREIKAGETGTKPSERRPEIR